VAKSSGLGWTTLTVGDVANSPEAIKNDVTNLTFATPRAVQDVTGVDKFAHERLLLLADGSITLNGVFNPAGSPSSHDVFSTVAATASVARTTTLVVSAKTLAMNLLYTDYTLTRAAAGELTWSAPGVLADGVVPTWS
jgi:hypothetical protein